jgi:hypothetical protein
MKWIFKFFIWRVTVKAGRLDGEDKVKFLLNELLKAIQSTGKQLVRESDGFGSLSIWMHNFGTDKAFVTVDNVADGFKIETKPNFNVTGVKHE